MRWPGCAASPNCRSRSGSASRPRRQAAEVAKAADAAVVGSAIVDRLSLNLDPAGNAKSGLVDAVFADVRALAAGVRAARRAET